MFAKLFFAVLACVSLSACLTDGSIRTLREGNKVEKVAVPYVRTKLGSVLCPDGYEEVNEKIDTSVAVGVLEENANVDHSAEYRGTKGAPCVKKDAQADEKKGRAARPVAPVNLQKQPPPPQYNSRNSTYTPSKFQWDANRGKYIYHR